MFSKAKAATRVDRARRLLCGASLSVLALVVVSPAARAQDATRYWDANGPQPTSGGSGNWDTTSQLWSESNSDVLGPYQVWNNAGLDNAFFGAPAAGTTATVGTITLTSPITVHNMTFQSLNGWILNGGTLTLGGATPTISNAGTVTINSIIAGASGLTKTGGGALTLAGTNTFSGGIRLGGGNLTAASDAGLGAASNTIDVTANSTLNIGGAPTARTVDIASGVTLTVAGAGVGGALYTGGGNILSSNGVAYTNDLSDFTGSITFRGVNGTGNNYFSSVRNLGEKSALGAPTDVVAGTIVFSQQSQYSDNLIYTGDGDTSDRNWDFNGNAAYLNNEGTGALNLTGDLDISVGGGLRAIGGDVDLSGRLSGGIYNFSASAGRKLTISGLANTYTGATGVTGLIEAASIADSGVASSLGAGSAINLTNGLLSYTGAAAASDRTWTSNGLNSLLNDGTGALSLSGGLSFVAGGVDTLTFGGGFAGENAFSGVISGTGNVVSNGAGTWVLSGANTYSGATTVTAGTLRAGSASAFGISNGVTVNGGVLDLAGFNLTTSVLHGTGGMIDLGTAILTVDGGAASDYAGAITGAGGLTKLGASTLTLTGANTYTGATTIGGGVLALNFAGAGAPANNIIASGSSLNLTGGTLKVTGAAGVANTQTFASTMISAGANTVQAVSGTAGGMDIDLGAISRTSGLVNFVLPTSGSIKTSSLSLGGWATINGTDYAKVVGGEVLPFVDTDYTDQDDVSQWAAGQFISDSDGDGLGYSGTLAASMQLGGLQFTEAAAGNVALGGQTLGVDGAIIVAPSVGGAGQTISGGNLTGASGGVLGIQQNGAGVFTVGATVVDNGGPTGFTKGGTGTVRLTGANTYTGVTTLSAGRLEINSLADGGAPSSIGQSGSGSGNLVLQGGTLAWAGGTDAATNRGFTLVNGGAGDPAIQVDTGRTVEFSGLVTSPDDAGLTKTGWGSLVLSNPANDYVGVTKITGSGAGGHSTLSVNTLANGGLVSGIGKSSAASSNLVLESGGELLYTGATDSIDRGFTLLSGGRIGVSQASTTLTVSGVAVGTGGFTKEGDGTLVLSGTNTYAGGTTVNGGKLVAGSNQAFGGAANGSGAGRLTVNAPASVDFGAFDVFVSGLQGDGTVTVGAGGTLQSNGSATFTGGIGGAGEVKLTAGTQVMTGCNNTYAGPTTIQNSTLSTDCLADGLQASGIGASGAGSANLVFSGGTLTYTGGSVSIDRGAQLLSNGAVTVQNAATTLGIEGPIIGAGNLAKNGAGVLELSGANTYSGGTNVNAGTLRALSASALGTGGVRLGPTGTLLDLTAVPGSAISVLWLDDITLNANAASVGNVELGATTLTITGGGAPQGVGSTVNYAGVISGTGGITKTSANIQQFSGCNSTYTGATTVSGGILAIDCLVDGGANSSIGSSSGAAANLILNGGTLRYIGAGDTTNRLFTLGASATSALDASGTGAVVFSNTAPITFSSVNTNQTVTLTGTSSADNKLGLQITENGTGKTGLTKSGLGTWILTNAGSTYTGVTRINGGVLGVDKLADGGQASSLGQSTNLASNLVIGGGGTLRYTGGGDTTDRRFTLGVGTTAIESSGSGAVVFGATEAISYTGNGQRVVSLGGTNTDDNVMGATIGDQTAANISSLAKNGAGKWILTGNNTYTGVTNINAGALVLGDGGTNGSIASQTVNNFGVLGFDRSDTLTYGGVVSQTGSVEQIGAGMTQLTGTNTYTGGTTISAGTLELGAGGSTGSILGDVTDNGVLSFNRDNHYAFTGLVSGSGELRQAGSGVTVLSAANSYLGATNVMAGTLRINGDQSAATGLTTVFTGGTLGGSGTVGGDVIVQNGGVLSPGNSPGTLTINGDLTLNGASVLNMEFGQANVAGGPLNDLIKVNGDLTLDGTLNVTEPVGGVFSAGVYRVIDYTGALTNNTLDVGALPAGSSATVQTSVVGQVNLVNTAGQSLFFWDGPTGGKNDSIVTGGAGTWRLGGGANDWTNFTGSANSDYQQDAYAVFQGTPGIVTVDNIGGAVGISGMQFAVDGYTVTGAGLNLAAAQTPIRVGDGSAAGAGMTATISSVLSGAGQLVKVDDGTLVLSGTNTYTGGTLIAGGVLSISNDSNLGDAAGGLTLDGGTLRTTSTATLGRAITLAAGGGTIAPLVGVTLSGDITGGGGLTKGGASILRLTGTNTYLGGTTVSAGVLVLGDGVATGSIVGDVLNNAQLAFNNPGVQTFDGVISGSGQVRKAGAGTEILTGANTYAGITTAAGGALLINGDQSGATGLTSANSGAVLGGSGTIGGDVTLAAGATLAPGGAAGAPSTLTIKGGLTLADATTILAYDFGQAGLPGGALNDLVKVGGDVDLSDATINVTAGASSFGPGLYRVIDYAGTRTGTLTLGAMPAGANFTVQTSVDKQVNLVNTAGLTLNLWDGDAGVRNDGDIAGGGGTWQGGGAGGNDNWTTAEGSLNAPFQDNAFAIFTKTGGTVTVDATTAGPINVSGMQFAVGGYQLDGGPINLTAPQSNIWVGDGTANSATMSALINATLGGTGGLVKTDAGTLLLTGNNIYSGETIVNGGTLVLNGNQSSATGATTINSGGVLQGNGVIGGDVTVNAGGTLSPGFLYGQMTINGGLTLTSGATLAMELGQAGISGGALNDLIRVGGDLTLDGALNVTESAGGTFGPGVYRLIDYTGALIDNGLTVASAPGGVAGLSVQTAVAGQINLINSAGQLLSFWDRAGADNDGVVSGGAGTWRLGGGGTDWTNETGSANTDYAQDTFAVFQGTAGTVTIDNSAGNVRATGLQFATDGYLLTGGPLEMTGPNALIRVGDGNATGAAYTATIAAAMTGAADFEKADLGTLALTGASNFGGDLYVSAGELRLADGGSLESAGGWIGGAVADQARLTVTGRDGGGAASTWTVGGDLAVGSGDTGMLNVAEGGKVVSDRISIGLGGVGTLRVDDGAAVSNGDGIVGASSQGDAVITGLGTTWVNAGQLVIGSFGAGALRIEDGASVTSNQGYVGANADGAAVVTGVGSQWLTATTLTVGNIGNGALTIENGGLVRAVDGVLLGMAAGSSGALTLQGTPADRAVLETAGFRGGSGAVDVAFDGGLLRATQDNLTFFDGFDTHDVTLGANGVVVDTDGHSVGVSPRLVGVGGLTKAGAGALTLTGANAYGGETTVTGGTLLVNGDQSLATGLTTVSAATLGGSGTIGGDVVLADGATLTPGSAEPGTLTIGGDLSLAAGARLAYEFGQAGIVGGPLNDLVNVGGDLTLDGVIDVTTSAGGAFDVGVYRVFNYAGALIDNGLTVGSLPGGGAATVQTSIAGQVNLVNSAGLALHFWDGAAGPKNDGAVNGGDGVWQNVSGNDNWTNGDGSVNGSFADRAFAVFQGAGGAVTVDNSLGQVAISGMQFAADGYRIVGEAILSSGPQTVVRVGDGSAAGAGFTATINATLSGGAQLVKTDAGTLVLAGSNSYTGGTAINGGAVQIASDGNLGDAAGDVTFNGGTLVTTADMASMRDMTMAGAGAISTMGGTTFSLGGLLSGPGALTKTGAGTLLLTGDNGGYTGATTVAAGTLAVTGKLGGAVAVESDGRLEGVGSVGDLVNAGVVAPGRDGFGTLTVTGAYAGSGGRLEIETALGGDDAQTDRLVITNGAAGATQLVVTNRGGLGAQTVEGIKIIDVTGDSAAGAFTLKSDYTFEGDPAVIAGAYGYRLYQGGVSTPADGDWYLRSALLNPQEEPQGPLYQPGVPIYESYPATLQALNRPGSLQERVGNRQWSGFTQAGVGMWARIEGVRYRSEAAVSTSRSNLQVDNWSFQAGFDGALHDSTAGTLIAGVNARYGEADAGVRSRFGNGGIDTWGYGVGATLTWYGQAGLYADAQAQVSWYRSDLASAALGELVDQNHGSGELLSLEVGDRAPLGRGLSITPQAQVVYSNVRFDRFADPSMATVSSDDADSLRSRLGVSFDHQQSWESGAATRQRHLYGIVNLNYEWLDGSVVGVSAAPLARRDDRLWGEVGFGGSYSWRDGRFTVFSEISASAAVDNADDSNSLRGNAGFRMRF